MEANKANSEYDTFSGHQLGSFDDPEEHKRKSNEWLSVSQFACIFVAIIGEVIWMSRALVILGTHMKAAGRSKNSQYPGGTRAGVLSVV